MESLISTPFVKVAFFILETMVTPPGKLNPNAQSLVNYSSIRYTFLSVSRIYIIEFEVSSKTKIDKEQELFIFSPAYRTRTLP